MKMLPSLEKSAVETGSGGKLTSVSDFSRKKKPVKYFFKSCCEQEVQEKAGFHHQGSRKPPKQVLLGVFKATKNPMLYLDLH